MTHHQLHQANIHMEVHVQLNGMMIAMAVTVIGHGIERDVGMTLLQSADVQLKEPHLFHLMILKLASTQESICQNQNTGTTIHISDQIYLVVQWNTM